MSWVVAVVVGFVCVYYCVWFISSVAFNVVSQKIGGWGESGRNGPWPSSAVGGRQCAYLCPL